MRTAGGPFYLSISSGGNGLLCARLTRRHFCGSSIGAGTILRPSRRFFNFKRHVSFVSRQKHGICLGMRLKEKVGPTMKKGSVLHTGCYPMPFVVDAGKCNLFFRAPFTAR